MQYFLLILVALAIGFTVGVLLSPPRVACVPPPLVQINPETDCPLQDIFWDGKGRFYCSPESRQEKSAKAH